MGMCRVKLCQYKQFSNDVIYYNNPVTLIDIFEETEEGIKQK
jgi:hypothetical protein